MTRTQEGKLSMYIAVRDYLQKNAEITNDLPNFAANLQDLQQTIISIQKTAEIQKINRKGAAKEKKLLRQKLVILALDNAHKIKTWASYTGNNELRNMIGIPKSTFTRATHTGVLQYANIILENAQANLESLASYGVTKDSVAEFSDCVKKYDLAISGPSMAKADHMKATKELIALFEHCDQMIDAITAAVGLVRLSNPIFVASFESMKRVIITGASGIGLKGIVVDSRSGVPIKGVTVTFTPDSELLSGIAVQVPIIKRSTIKGHFVLKNIPEASYTIDVRKMGYKDKILTMKFAAGDTKELRVELEAA